MATTIKSEVSVKNLETVSNGFKITSEVRLGSGNKVQSMNGQIQDGIGNYIGSFNSSEQNGKLSTNISVQDDSNRASCNTMLDELISDIAILFAVAE